MKAYKRREANAYPYFKLATWDDRNMTWKAGKVAVASESKARSKANQRGRYRIERFDECGNLAMEPFDV